MDMRKFVVVMAFVIVFSGPVFAQEWLEVVTPDAAIWAQTIDNGDSYGIEGVSFVLGTVKEYRGWLDVLKPVDRVGVGVSIDVKPGAPLCIGSGYQADYGWIGYVGAHVGF